MKIIKVLGIVLCWGIVSCGTAKRDNSTIEVWIPPFASRPDVLDKNVWEEIVQPFAEEHNLTINISIIPWSSYEEKYLTGISSGQGPDIGYIYDTLISEFYNLEVIAPLDPYITDKDRENFLYLKNGVYKDTQIALPLLVGNPRILLYNKDILDSLNEKPPVTWEDFIRIAQKATKDLNGDGTIDQWGFTQPWGHPHFGSLNDILFPFLWQAGAEFFSEDGTKTAFNTPEGLRAVTFLKDLKDKYKIIPPTVLSFGFNNSFELFNTGKSAFIIGTPGAVIGLEQVAEFDWGYVPALKDKYSLAPYVTDSLFMMSSVPEEKRQLVYDLMVFMLSADSMAQFHQKLASFPPITKDGEYYDHPKFKKLHTEQSQFLRMKDDKIVGAPQIYDLMLKNLQKMIAGELTPQEALDNTQREGDKILSSQ